MTGPIQRVVVRLDASSESRGAIDTAARLAARAHAPLHGVFVEDEELLHLAGLPFARQVVLGAGAQRLTLAEAELHQKAAAEKARAELMATAKRHHVKASFEIVRATAECALAGASATDLVVAGATTRPVAGHFRLGRRWWSSIAVTPAPFLLVRHAWSGSGLVVMLLHDRSAASARLLETAAQIAHAGDSGLTVISPPAIAGTKGFDKWLSERLGDNSVRVQIEVAPAEPEDLPARLAELNCHLLAVQAGLAEGTVERLREFVERLACDVLIGR